MALNLLRAGHRGPERVSIPRAPRLLRHGAGYFLQGYKTLFCKLLEFLGCVT